MDFGKIIDGVTEFTEIIINPSLIQFSQIYEYLNFLVFVGFIILGLGLTKVIEQKTNKLVAIAITVILALSAVVNKQFFPILILMIAAIGSILKAVGGFMLSKYLLDNKKILIAFIIILIVTFLMLKLYLTKINENFLELYKLALIIFTAYGNYYKLDEIYFRTPLSHHQTILGLTILIALTNLIDFSSINISPSSAFVNSMIIVFFTYTFIAGFLAGFLHYFLYER